MRDKPHLLLVDDDADILGLLEDFFRKQGYEVTVAADGVAMFAALVSQTIDMVILDVMLGTKMASACAGNCAGIRRFQSSCLQLWVGTPTRSSALK